MKKHIVEFLKRGLIFGGFGPIVLGIVYYIISLFTPINLLAGEVLVAIVSAYILAFIQAGVTVFKEIESWGLTQMLLIHMVTLYIAYLGCYLVNSWIPFDWIVVLIFTLIFVVTFLIIWFIVYFIIKCTTKKLNEKL